MLTKETQTGVLEKILQLVQESPSACQLLWDSDELVFVLLQNFTFSFYKINTEAFTQEDVYKIRMCIDILSSIVEKIQEKEYFMALQLDYYIYPFLMSAGDESLKISTMKLFLALLRSGVSENIRNSELLPLILKIADSGNETSQILALETLDLIMQGDGFDYAVQTIDRFQAIDIVLSSLMKKSVASRNSLLIRQLLKIYTKLCEKNNVRMKLKEKPPEGLEMKELQQLCEEDAELCALLCMLQSKLHTE